LYSVLGVCYLQNTYGWSLQAALVPILLADAPAAAAFVLSCKL
jgi:hypothetical protein